MLEDGHPHLHFPTRQMLLLCLSMAEMPWSTTMVVKNVLAYYVMGEWANKLMMTNSSASNRGKRVPWKSKLGGVLLLTVPTALQWVQGTLQTGLLTCRAERRIMWYRMMFFLLGRVVSVGWSWWNLLCFVPFLVSAWLNDASLLCLSGERINHLIPASVKLSCQPFSVCCNKRKAPKLWLA